MKYLMRWVLVLVVTCLVFAVAGIIATWAPDRTVAQLAPRWAPAPSQFISVQGMQIHVRDEGPRDDPVPLVLLHGTSASLHTWDGWVQALQGQRRVIRFDLPGFGLTGPHPDNDYSAEAYVRTVQGVVDALGVKNFVLAGNSLGGYVAWSTAVALPQRVQRLILVDAAGYPLPSQSVPIGFRIAQIPGLRRLMEVILPRGVIASSLRNVYGNPDKVTPELIDRYYELTLRAGNREALGYRFAQMRPADLEKRVGQIKTLQLPTLILWGARDRLIPVQNAVRFAADIVGSKLVVLDELGHVPQEEDPLQTVSLVRSFLQNP